jgi:putative FmdB family regulatory protein
MPIYEYHCERCNRNFELIQKFSDQPLTEHEGCGGAVERLISSPALQFKGTGWYITDYARKNGGSANGKSESTGKSEAKSDSNGTPAKSESKPASTSETSATKSDSKNKK